MPVSDDIALLSRFGLEPGDLVVTNWDDSSGIPVRVSQEIIRTSAESFARLGEQHCQDARNQRR
jgi:hypothetical protein